MNCPECKLAIPALQELFDKIESLEESYEDLSIRFEELQTDYDNLDEKYEKKKLSLNNSKDIITDLEETVELLTNRLSIETESRLKIEIEKENLSKELEELTQKLFQEAQGMAPVEERAKQQSKTAMDVILRQLDEEKRISKDQKARIEQMQQTVAALEKIMPKDWMNNQDQVLQWKITEPLVTLYLDKEDLPDLLMDDLWYELDSHSLSLFKIAVEELATIRNTQEAANIDYFKRLVDELIVPCFNFNDKTVAGELLQGLIGGTLMAVEGKFPKNTTCHFCGNNKDVEFKYQIANDEEWVPIDERCFARLDTALDAWFYIQWLSKEMRDIKEEEEETGEEIVDDRMWRLLYSSFLGHVRQLVVARWSIGRFYQLFDAHYLITTLSD